MKPRWITPPPVLIDSDRALVRELENEATERWGNEWAISIRRWVDGTATIYAEHCLGPTTEGYRKNERLMPTATGSFVHDVVTVERSETVSSDVIERIDGTDTSDAG